MSEVKKILVELRKQCLLCGKEKESTKSVSPCVSCLKSITTCTEFHLLLEGAMDKKYGHDNVHAKAVLSIFPAVPPYTTSA